MGDCSPWVTAAIAGLDWGMYRLYRLEGCVIYASGSGIRTFVSLLAVYHMAATAV